MTEHSQETKIAILEAKVEHMMGHVKELTLRVRANEKVVASVSLLGVIACTFIGAGYFAPKAEACSKPLDGSEFTCPPHDGVNPQPRIVPEPEPKLISHMRHTIPTGEWIQKMRDWESRKTRTNPEDSINNALANLEWNYGSNDPTEQEELLQLPSNGD